MAGWCYDRRRRVLLAWFALLILTSVVSQMVGADFKDKLNGGHSESQQAQDLLRANFPIQAGDSAQVVFRTATPISDPANKAKIDALVDEARGAPPRRPPCRARPCRRGQFQISRDGHIAYATLLLDKDTPDISQADLQKIVDVAEAARADRIRGRSSVVSPSVRCSKPAFGASEGIGILAAMIILLVAFGSLIAMGLPIVTALFGIGVGVAVVSLLSRVADRAELRHRARRHDRHRRRHRLRAVHRHPLPPGSGRGTRSRAARWSAPSTRRAAPCCSRAAPS